MNSFIGLFEPLHLLFVFFITIVMIGVFRRHPDIREFWTFAAAFANFFIVLSMLPSVLGGEVKTYHLFSIMPGIDMIFKVDALSMILGLTTSSLWIVTSIYSVTYIRNLFGHSLPRYFSSFAISVGATMGVAFSDSLFTLFIFYELLTLATIPLVIHKGTDEAKENTKKYLIYLFGTSTFFFLTAILLTYHFAGTLAFKAGGILMGTASDTYLFILFLLFLAGISKSAIMPFHSWLPAAMVAPTPVSALLHAVAVVKVGVFTVIKVVLFIFGVNLLKDIGANQVLTYIAAFTIIFAAFSALNQDNLKKRLAYSTISQLSYILMAVSMLTAAGVKSGLLHILFHAYGKITLFLAAGSIYFVSRKTNIKQLAGIGRRMPWTMGAFAIGALSMIGIPPAVGFLSKWFLLQSSIETNNWFPIGIIVTSSLLNVAYFLPIIYIAFFKKEETDLSNHLPNHKEAPLPIVVALSITAIGTLLLFFFPEVPIKLADLVIKTIL